MRHLDRTHLNQYILSSCLVIRLFLYIWLMFILTVMNLSWNQPNRPLSIFHVQMITRLRGNIVLAIHNKNNRGFIPLSFISLSLVLFLLYQSISKVGKFYTGENSWLDGTRSRTTENQTTFERLKQDHGLNETRFVGPQRDVELLLVKKYFTMPLGISTFSMARYKMAE